MCPSLGYVVVARPLRKWFLSFVSGVGKQTKDGFLLAVNGRGSTLVAKCFRCYHAEGFLLVADCMCGNLCLELRCVFLLSVV